MSKNTRNRILLTAVAALLLVAVAVGGTMAYLQATSGPVTNTFKPSNVTVKVEESVENTFQVIPGVEIYKDPVVSATANVDSWVFVKIVKSENWPAGVDYEVAGGWTEVNGTNEVVWYRELTVDENANDVAAIVNGGPWAVLKDNKLTVTTDVNVTADFTLAFDAYIIQQAGFASAEAAWNEFKIEPSATLPTT